MSCLSLRVRRAVMIVVVLAVCLAPFSVHAGGRLDREFNSWSTVVYEAELDAYAMATIDSNDRSVALQLFKYPGKCSSPRFFIIVTFSQPAMQDFSRKDVHGEMRVDTYPVHKTTSEVEYKTGQKDGLYFVHSFENADQVLQELSQGKLVRFKFNLDGREYFFRFPLSGFGQAYQRISQLCAPAPSNKRPAPKQRQDSGAKEGKGDSDYFGNSKKPEGKTSKSDKDFF